MLSTPSLHLLSGPLLTGGVIIMSRSYHWSPLPSLATRLYRLSLPVGLPDWRGPQEYIPYKAVLTSPAVSHKSSSSNLDNFRDGWLVAIQLLFCRVLPPALAQYGSQNSFVSSFSIRLVSVSTRPLLWCTTSMWCIQAAVVSILLYRMVIPV